MIAIKTTPARAAHGFPAFGTQASRMVRSLSAVWTVMRRHRNTSSIGDVADLNDRLLADVGLTRRDLPEPFQTSLPIDPSMRLVGMLGYGVRPGRSEAGSGAVRTIRRGP